MQEKRPTPLDTPHQSSLLRCGCKSSPIFLANDHLRGPLGLVTLKHLNQCKIRGSRGKTSVALDDGVDVIRIRA